MRRFAALISTLAFSLVAPASGEVIATLGENVPISAGHGWLVWSTPLPDGYGLTAWRGGVTAALPVRPRARPFDLDVGTDVAGRDVVTYSRAGRVHVLELVSGRDYRPAIPHPAHTTDRWPSMWHGQVAFARSDARGRPRVRVLLWAPRTRRVTGLPHGILPRGRRDVFMGVQGMDLGPRFLAYLWWAAGPGIIGSGGGQELRVVRLADDHVSLAASGYAGEVCTGGPDTFSLSAPTLIGPRVWYMQTTSSCYAQTSRVARYGTGTQSARSGAITGTLLHFAADRHAVYVLAGQPTPSEPPTCTPCTLERLPAPALTRREHAARPPTY
jgi:hypothetical protein